MTFCNMTFCNMTFCNMSLRIMRLCTTALCALAVVAVANASAWSEETLKVAVPQRGAWDAGLAELGQRGGIFKKHGLNLEILYTQAGPESIQALIGGSIDIATASGVSAAVGTFAKGAPIRIIGSEIVGSPDLYWYVPSSSPIRKVEDFNDKTVAYSLTGSSSHAGLLALIAQHKLTAKPTSTGSITATLTQTMTGQVDVGFSAIPFFLDQVDAGKIRIIATGAEVASLRSRTGRVNLTNVATLQNRKDALVRFHRAYKETIDWMYSDPAALKHFSDYAGLPEKVVIKVRELLPKETMFPDRLVGVDQIMSEAVSMKFLPAPLTAEQVKELVQIPN
jgi:NitT/TauT family transport system substrate-binding protein